LSADFLGRQQVCPTTKEHDRTSQAQPERDLGECPPAAPDGDQRLTSSGNQRVAGLANPCADDVLDPGIRRPVVVAGDDPDGHAAGLPRATTGRGHRSTKTTADQRATALGHQSADCSRQEHLLVAGFARRTNRNPWRPPWRVAHCLSLPASPSGKVAIGSCRTPTFPR
jgi:hypothetical protein